MDSLHAKCEEIFTNTLISTIQLDRLVIALSEVTKLVVSSKLPKTIENCVLIRALQNLRSIENQKHLLDLGYAVCIPHPVCRKHDLTLGELWELPLEHEWLCSDCGRPLYDISENGQYGERGDK